MRRIATRSSGVGDALVVVVRRPALRASDVFRDTDGGETKAEASGIGPNSIRCVPNGTNASEGIATGRVDAAVPSPCGASRDCLGEWEALEVLPRPAEGKQGSRG